MSEAREMAYVCPYCGKAFEITTYTTVNTRDDPDLRDRCLSGDIFRHTCPHCHTQFMVQPHMVYTDMDHRFILWLSDVELPPSVKAYAQPLAAAGFRLRRCSTIEEFTEKIQVFEDGMDDILVEIAKYDCFIEFIDNRKGNPADITSIEYQSTKNDVMKINIRTDDKGMSFHIPVNLLEEEIKAEADLYSIDEAEIPLVNSAWVISLFTQAQGNA